MVVAVGAVEEGAEMVVEGKEPSENMGLLVDAAGAGAAAALKLGAKGAAGVPMEKAGLDDVASSPPVGGPLVPYLSASAWAYWM